jgi:hypothetical protein
MTVWANRSLVRRLENGVSTIVDLFARPPTAEQAALSLRLRQELGQLTRDSQDLLPFWRSICTQLLHYAETEDPRYFMRWPPVAATMVNGTTPFSAEAFRRLRRAPEWRSRWRAAVTHEPHGHGPPFLPYLRTNANTIMHAAHLWHFKATTGQDLLEHECIVEFGGGYGSMGRLVHRLGFRGRYTIFDLAPILALQRYFLGLHGVEADYTADSPIRLTASLSEATAGMRPRTALMSTWALSEMPLALRTEIVALLEDCRIAAVLLAYQHSFEGLDNVAWFRDLAERTADHWRWVTTPIGIGSDYLVGIRRSPRGPCRGVSPAIGSSTSSRPD